MIPSASSGSFEDISTSESTILVKKTFSFMWNAIVKRSKGTDAKYIDKLGKIILVFMPHIIHVAGNGRFIAWAHSGPDGARTALESRPHVSIYEGISDEESSYVAAHVGLFWCIGTFRIKNDQSVHIVASDAKAPSLFTGNIPSSKLITEKMHFIKDLCDKRNIQISYIKDECTNPAEDEISRLCAQ